MALATVRSSSLLRVLIISARCKSDSKWPKPPKINLKLKPDFKFTRMTHMQRLKVAFAEYGPALVAVHIGISLISLSSIYCLLKMGFDVTGYLVQWTDFFSRKFTQRNFLAEAGTFAVAYALHKAIMPIRIMATVFLTPGFARWLQRRGFRIKK